MATLFSVDPLITDLAIPAERAFRLGVLSDTHRYSRGAPIPEAALDRLEVCDAYLHLGDFVNPDFLLPLERRGPVYVVLGNVDPPLLRPDTPRARLLRIGQWHVGAVHEAGRSLAAWRRTANAFPERVNVLCFGHSHRPIAQNDAGRVFLNPGSAVDSRGWPDCSVAVLLLGDRLEVHLMKLPAPGIQG